MPLLECIMMLKHANPWVAIQLQSPRRACQCQLVAGRHEKRDTRHLSCELYIATSYHEQKSCDMRFSGLWSNGKILVSLAFRAFSVIFQQPDAGSSPAFSRCFDFEGLLRSFETFKTFAGGAEGGA